MKTFTAPLIITLAGPPLVNAMISVDEQGVITRITGSVSQNELPEETEFFDGILVPGFVNAHCHLELSHLAGQTSQGKGIGHFIGEINRLRNVPDENLTGAAFSADQMMAGEGIVAGGDISNSSLTAGIKKKSKISWFTFVEVFGFHPSRAARALEGALAVRQAFAEKSLPASIVPHSPYSVSDELFGNIAGLSPAESSILSMHNQESQAENRFFRNGDGPILDHLRTNLGLDTSHWKPTGKNSLESVLDKIPARKPLLLVHNTYMGKSDIEYLKLKRSPADTWLVLCPNSNLYIEGELPPVSLFRSEGMQLCIGTDSLASNHSLSVMQELILLQHHFPGIRLEEMLSWACLNGAKALGMSDRFGSLETGKNPGIVGITGCDMENLSLTSRSRANRLA